MNVEVLQIIFNMAKIELWTIILTAINTIAVVIIAIVQIRIQYRQSKMQEYELYKDLYSLVNDIHHNVNCTIHHIANILIKYKQYEYHIAFLKDFKEEISNLSKKLSEHKNDLELKSSITNWEYNNYELILDSMTFLTLDIMLLLKNGSLLPLTFDNTSGLKDEDCIAKILSNIEETERMHLKKDFECFIKLKTKIEKYKILESLKKHCVL